MAKVKKLLYFISDRKLTPGAAALILATTGFVSNLTGVFKYTAISSTLSIEAGQADIFNAAFKLPDLIFNIFTLGALTSAFMPIFIDKVVKENEDSAWRYASNFLNFLLIIISIFGLIIFLFAPSFVTLLMPGKFWDNPDPVLFDRAVSYTRVLILSPILFSVSTIFTGVLQSLKKFFYSSLAPIVYNLSFIASFALMHRLGADSYYLLPAFGVVVGAALHAAIQYPSLVRSGYRWQPILDFKDTSIKKTLQLMAPRALAIGVGQINLLVDTIVASFFVYGISVLTYSDNIQTLPTVIFGLSFATAIFPFLSESSSKGDKKQFLISFSWAARRILFFIIPATVGILVLRAQIIRLVYGWNVNTFTWESTYWTIRILAFQSLGIVAYALIPLLLKAFYALQDTKTPLLIAFLVMIVNTALSVTLPWMGGLNLGAAGIALAFSLSGILNAVLLFIFLHKKIGALDRDHRIFDSVFRLIVSSVIMGVVCYFSLYFFEFFLDTQKVVGLALQALGAISVSAVTYFLLTYLLKCEETDFVFNKLTKVKNSFLPSKAS